MSERIKNLYRKANLTPPVGKGEHTLAFHAMAVTIKKENPNMPMSVAYAIAMKELGRNKAVNRSHWNPDYKPDLYAIAKAKK